MKLEKLYKDIFEANVGDKLFADQDKAYDFRNLTGFDKDFYKWVERVYGPDYEPNTPEENEMLLALGRYFGDVRYAKDLGKHVEDLKALKAKFPSMLDPKGTKLLNPEFPGYAMRGAKLPIDQYEKLIRNAKLYSTRYTGILGLIDNPGITYKSRGQYGFTSFSLDFAQATKFARSFKEKDFVSVVYGIKLDDPNLVVNPTFANKLSSYKENETLYVGNTIEPDFVVVVDPRMESNFLYDAQAKEIEDGLKQYSLTAEKYFPEWVKTHTPRFEDFDTQGYPLKDKDKNNVKNENMNLYEIYTDMLISEVGEGTSEPFFYQETFRSSGGSNFAYEIDGRVENEDGKVLQLIPIKLQGIGFKTFVDQEDGDWEIDGYEDNEKGKFFNVSPGTYLKGIEIIFSHIGRENSFSEVNDRVFMFRLMATIKKILNEEFSKNGEPDILIYSPTKQGDEAADKTGRHRLYNAFIKKAFPSARVYVDRKEDEITYKLK